MNGNGIIRYESDSLAHYGVLGMKWGVRRYQNKDGTLTSAGKQHYYKDSNKQITINKDGSYTIPKGFVFNRVGQKTLDVNKSGGLYVSYGKRDAARYVKNLGPTRLGTILGTAGTTVQHIAVNQKLRMPSEAYTIKETSKLLLNNKQLLKEFNDSIYSMVIEDVQDIDSHILKKCVSNPDSRIAKQIAFGVSAFLGNSNYSESSKIVYNHFRDLGFDALPDLNDIMGGTAEAPIVVLNPDKVSMISSFTITKETMKEAKRYVKEIGKLKVDEVLR